MKDLLTLGLAAGAGASNMVTNAGKSEVGAGATVSGLTRACAHPSKSYYSCCCRYLHLISHLNAFYLPSIYYLFTIYLLSIYYPNYYPYLLSPKANGTGHLRF